MNEPTLRQWYAGIILPVVAVKSDKIKFPKNRLNDAYKWRKELALGVAKKCFIMADAMIEIGGE